MKLIRQIQKYTNSLFKRRVIILEPKLLQHHHLRSDPNRLADRRDEGIRKRDSEFHRGNSPFPAGSFSFQRHSFSLGMYALLRRSASALHTLRSSQPFRRCIMGSRLLGWVFAFVSHFLPNVCPFRLNVYGDCRSVSCGTRV